LIRVDVEPYLVEFGADLYFAGHTHHYMRTWPVRYQRKMNDDYVNPRGVVHIQSGIGGVDGEDDFTVPMARYDAWRDEKYYRSYSRLTVHNATHLTVSQHNAVDGVAFDSYVVQQENHGPFL